GGVEARSKTIETFLENQKDLSLDHQRWNSRKIEIDRFIKEVESNLTRESSAPMLSTLGSGLSAVNASLTLYLDHLSSREANNAPLLTPDSSPLRLSEDLSLVM